MGATQADNFSSPTTHADPPHEGPPRRGPGVDRSDLGDSPFRLAQRGTSLAMTSSSLDKPGCKFNWKWNLFLGDIILINLNEL